MCARVCVQEGLLQLLFATETFALGLNMPARAVVFTASSKWDGRERRPYSTSEFTPLWRKLLQSALNLQSI